MSTRVLSDAIVIVRWAVDGLSTRIETTIPDVAAWYVLQANDSDWAAVDPTLQLERIGIIHEAIQWLGTDDAISVARSLFGNEVTFKDCRKIAYDIITHDSDSDTE